MIICKISEFYDDMYVYNSQNIVNNFVGGLYMKSVYCSWKDEEIIKLFSFVEMKKKQNIPLLTIFADYAKISGRKQNSVRNYYYAELGNLEKDEEKKNRLKIDLSFHSKIKQIPFDKSSEKDIIKKILEKTSKGISVRKACLQLANFDLDTMIRYQNKYRNIVKTNPKLLEDCAKELKLENVPTSVDSTPKNVLFMPKQKTNLTDKDIESLFMGLVRLVKRVANENAQNMVKSQIKDCNFELKKAFAQLTYKDVKIKNLSEQLKDIKTKNQKLEEEIKDAKKIIISNKSLQKSDNYNRLEKFASTLSKRSMQKLKA